MFISLFAFGVFAHNVLALKLMVARDRYWPLRLIVPSDWPRFLAASVRAILELESDVRVAVTCRTKVRTLLLACELYELLLFNLSAILLLAVCTFSQYCSLGECVLLIALRSFCSGER